MRAFRIYRPQLLGFDDEFDKAERPTPTASATDELKAMETKAEDNALEASKIEEASPVDNTEKTKESELFLDAGSNSGSW